MIRRALSGITLAGAARTTALLLWLLPRRMRSAWGLLAVTAFGVLAAVTIMALGAMYSQALAEAGLRHALAVTSPTIINTQIIVRNRPLGAAGLRRPPYRH